jgi:hypothetical protein
MQRAVRVLQRVERCGERICFGREMHDNFGAGRLSRVTRAGHGVRIPELDPLIDAQEGKTRKRKGCGDLPRNMLLRRLCCLKDKAMFARQFFQHKLFSF